MNDAEHHRRAGYRQALLDVAYALDDEHVGDVARSVDILWKAAGMGEIPRDESSGEVDAEEIVRRGGRFCCDVDDLGPAGREQQLLDLLGALCSSFPNEGEQQPMRTLAEILGVRLLQSPSGERVGMDPDSLPYGYDDQYSPDMTGWGPADEVG